jgi:hypothetical protein
MGRAFGYRIEAGNSSKNGIHQYQGGNSLSCWKLTTPVKNPKAVEYIIIVLKL